MAVFCQLSVTIIKIIVTYPNIVRFFVMFFANMPSRIPRLLGAV